VNVIYFNRNLTFSCSESSFNFGMNEVVCKKCSIRSTPVLGSGPGDFVVFVGEAPGIVEVNQKKPFVGPAGQFLDECLAKVSSVSLPVPGADIRRKSVRFENIVKCPPFNSDGTIGTPPAECVRLCKYHLFSSLEELNPKLIVTLGSVATGAFLSDDNVTNIRGYLFDFEWNGRHYPVLPTYHPDFILRNKTEEIVASFMLDLVQARIIADLPYRWEKPGFTIVKNLKEAQELANELLNYEGLVACDLETKGRNESAFYDTDSKIIGIGFHFNNKTVFLPWLHKQSPFYDDNFVIIELIKLYREVFSKIRIIAHNAVFDSAWIYSKIGATVNVAWDTMCANHHIYYGDCPSTLEYVAARYLKVPVWKSMLTKDDLDEEDLTTIAQYCSCDVTYTYEIYLKQKEILERTGFLESYYYHFIRVLPVIIGWKIRGVCIDEQLRQNLAKDFSHYYNELMKPVYESVYFKKYQEYCYQKQVKVLEEIFDSRKSSWKDKVVNSLGITVTNDDYSLVRRKYAETTAKVPEELNVRSVNDMVDFVVNVLKLPVVEKGKKYPSFGKNSWETYINLFQDKKLYDNDGKLVEDPVIYQILISLRDARHLSYLKSGFLDNLPEHYPVLDVSKEKIWQSLLPKPEGPTFVYPDVNISGTATGRYSVSNPPLHGFADEENLPIKRLVVSRYRDVGGLVFNYDIDQTEYRVIACLAEDQRMLEIYRSGSGDLHLFISAKFCNLPESEIHPAIRRLMKRASFCVCFGGGDETLKETLQSLLAAASQIQDPSVQSFLRRLETVRSDISVAASFIKEEFFKNFPGISAYHENIYKYAISHSYVVSPTGRRRWLLPIFFNDHEIRTRAINSRVQTAASDLVNSCFAVDTQLTFEELGLKSFVYLTRHDSVCIDLYPSEINLAINIAYGTVKGSKNFANCKIPDKSITPYIKKYFEKWPYTWVKVPITCKMKIGASEGDVLSLKICEGFYEVSGKQDRYVLFIKQLMLAKERGLIDFEVFDKEIKEDNEIKACVNILIP